MWPTKLLIQSVKGVVPPGVKPSVCEADHSHPSVAEDKNGGAILSLPHTPTWRYV
jgi:hypothetical protein